MNPEPNFNPIARPYRRLEYLTLGRALERCRLHFLPALLHRKKALVIGDGDGRFLAALLAANPRIHADAVDTSATMLRLLSRRCEANAMRLETHHTSALAFAPTGPYDLVVTHFFLDCLTQPDLEALVARITPALAPDALWLVSDFRIPSGLMRLPAQIIVRALYLAFRVLTGLRTARLPDHAASLTKAGFLCTSRYDALAGLIAGELWHLSPSSNNSGHEAA